MFEFRFIFHWILSNLLLVSIGSDNGLSPSRRQAIVWINDGLVYWRIYASLVLNQLRPVPSRQNAFRLANGCAALM